MNRDSVTWRAYIPAITTRFNALRHFDVRRGKRSPAAFALSLLLAVSGCDDSIQAPTGTSAPSAAETTQQSEVTSASQQLDSLIKRYADAQIDDDQNTE